MQSAGDPEQNGAVPIHIPRCANASLVSKIAVTAKTILNGIIDASLSVTDVEGFQSGYADPPQRCVRNILLSASPMLMQYRDSLGDHFAGLKRSRHAGKPGSGETR